MRIDWQKVGIKKLAAIISAHLHKNGIEVVLVGGACVSLYSNNQYMSYDIDLITESPIRKIIPVRTHPGYLKPH
jgi:predicted nucleotidyltransferase